MAYEFDWTVLLTYKQLLIDGFMMTLKLSIIGIFFSFIIGSLIGLMRVSSNFMVSLSGTYYVEFFRNIPLIVQMFFIYFSFTLTDTFPMIETFGNMIGVQNHNEFFSALIALITYTSTYIAEAVRAGIQTLPKGQMEASKTIGMNYVQSMYYVVFPQAIKMVWGPITSQFLNLIKNSSLAMTIGVAELTFQTQEIDSLTFRGFEAASAVTILYLFLTLATAYLMSLVNKYALIKTESNTGATR
ncbi:MAG: His/Glu/Gln/Arg/opine family amino acid ABC transporter permease subunit [Arcobacteraceae bacterium]|jgi:His/Glu/Gln/Arg/opine family amino acid ABC transporter permease subunit